MELYLGLGSNEGDRRQHLRSALDALRERGLAISAVSPVVESPALLPDDAPAEWNQPFLNLVVAGELDAAGIDPTAFRSIIREIEDAHRRVRTSRWAPRPLDIDILLWGRERVRTELLQIPHPDLLSRNFVLTPLLHINPHLRIPGCEEKTVFEWSLGLAPIPLWMGIINLTPDSFSDGGSYSDTKGIIEQVSRMVQHGVHVIDIGAESTRPGAQDVDGDREWARLEKPLCAIQQHLASLPLRPKISIDTRHWQVAEQAIRHGVEIINDVSGLTDPMMQKLARESQCEWVAVHNLTVPANPKVRLAPDRSPVEQVEAWLQRQLSEWTAAGIDTRRLYFDPGIGFGKDSLQSLQLLRGTRRLREAGLRLAIGHSRKSFMTYSGDVPYAARDFETIGASLRLCAAGVDMLRVHDVEGHVRAYRSWAHVEGFPDAAGCGG